MKPSPLFAIVGQLKNIHGIEATLRKRTRNGLLLSSGTVLIGILEVLRELQSYESIAAYTKRVVQTSLSTGEFLFSYARYWVLPSMAPPSGYAIAYDVLGIYVVLAGIVVYFVNRHTAFLFKSSQQPFHYTFWIAAFQKLESSGNIADFGAGDDEIQRLLHHDLMAMLKQRIGRFSLLDDTHLQGGISGNATPPSHIHIDGSYAIRERERDGERVKVVQVMPRVRFGPPGSPSILTPPVEVDVGLPARMAAEAGPAAPGGWPGNPARDPAAEPDAPYPAGSEGSATACGPPGPMDSDDGENAQDLTICKQVREQVYSRVASEIYRQIRIDIESKLKLFPTRRLRSVALYYEARDFSQSNTIDSYDYAIELYRQSLNYYRMSARAILLRWLAAVRFIRIGIEYELMHARTKIAYARSLIYRRVVSSLTGRAQNSLYEIPAEINAVARQLTRLHNKFHMRKWTVSHIDQTAPSGTDHDVSAEVTRYYLSVSALLYGEDGWVRKHLGRKLEKRKFEACRRLLFDAYVVLALTYANLGGMQKARDALALASATDPEGAMGDALFLLTKAETTPDPRRKAPLLLQATELDPQFEIAQYLLAQNALRLTLVGGEIDAGLCLSAIRELDNVLRINPGNVAAYANLGNLEWMIGRPNAAKLRFEQGMGTKTAVQQTFIGELVYGLARIAAVRGEFNQCRALYSEALSAEPGIGAYSLLKFGERLRNLSHYDFTSPDLLRRYRLFLERFESAICAAHEIASVDDLLDHARLFKAMGSDGVHLLSLLQPGDVGATGSPGEGGAPAAKDLVRQLRLLLARPDLPAYLLHKKAVAPERIDEIKRMIVYAPDERVSTIRLNRHLLDELYPNCFRRCRDAHGKEISVLTVNSTYSFVLNDYANACLNYFHRFGEEDHLRVAIKVYDRAIALKPDNAIAYYNQQNAVLWLGVTRRGDNDEGLPREVMLLEKAHQHLPIPSPAIIISAASKRMELLLEKVKHWQEKVAKHERDLADAVFTTEQLRQEISAIERRLLRRPDAGTGGEARGSSFGSDASADADPERVNAEFSDRAREEVERRRGGGGRSTTQREALPNRDEQPFTRTGSAGDQANLRDLDRRYGESEKRMERVREVELPRARAELLNTERQVRQQFVEGFRESIRLSGLSDVFEGLGFDGSERTISGFEKLKIEPARLTAVEIEVLTGCATLLSKDKTNEHNMRRCIELCDFIEKMDPDTFTQDDMRLGAFQRLEWNEINGALKQHAAASIIDRQFLPEAFAGEEPGVLLSYGLVLPQEVTAGPPLVSAIESRLGEVISDDPRLDDLMRDLRHHRNKKPEFTLGLTRLFNALICSHFVREGLLNAGQTSGRLGTLMRFALEKELEGIDLFRLNRRVLELLFPDQLAVRHSRFYARRLAEKIDQDWLTEDPVHYLAIWDWGPAFLSVPELEARIQHALELEPPHEKKLHEQLVHLYLNARGYEGLVEKKLEQAIEKYPGTSVFRLALSDFYRDQQKFDDARDQLNQARDEYVEVRDQYAAKAEAIYTGEVEHLRQSGDWHGAIAKSREGCDLLPGSTLLEYVHESTVQWSRSARFERYYGEKWATQLPIVTPVGVEIAGDLIPLVALNEKLTPALEGSVASMRARLKTRYGVNIPGIRFLGNERDLPNSVYILKLNEVPITSGAVDPTKELAIGSADVLEAMGHARDESSTLAVGRAVFWIDPDDRSRVAEQGIALWPPIDLVVSHLEALLANNLANFLGHQEVHSLVVGLDVPDTPMPLEWVERLEEDPRVLGKLTSVLRGLLAGKVPIRELACILDYVERHDDASPSRLIAGIRQLPQIVPDLPGNSGVKRYIRLGDTIEREFAVASDERNGRAVLAMAPDTCQEILSAVRSTIGESRSTAIIVQDSRLRPLAHQLFKLEFPQVPVIAKDEILNFSQVASREMDVVELEVSS